MCFEIINGALMVNDTRQKILSAHQLGHECEKKMDDYEMMIYFELNICTFMAT